MGDNASLWSLFSWQSMCSHRLLRHCRELENLVQYFVLWTLLEYFTVWIHWILDCELIGYSDGYLCTSRYLELPRTLGNSATSFCPLTTTCGVTYLFERQSKDPITGSLDRALRRRTPRQPRRPFESSIEVPGQISSKKTSLSLPIFQTPHVKSRHRSRQSRRHQTSSSFQW